MSQSIENRVIQLIAKTQKLAPENIQLDQFIDELCEDSLDLVNLLFELEDEFDVDIPDEAKESKSIRDIIAGIEQLVHAKQNDDVVA